jgi:hypothetical protein
MPWPNLKYDSRLGGYRVGVTEDQLKGAPKYNRNTDWDWSDRSRRRPFGTTDAAVSFKEEPTPWLHERPWPSGFG